MDRSGTPYDNAYAESFMKTLKVEAVYPMAYEAFNVSDCSVGTSGRISTGWAKVDPVVGWVPRISRTG